MSQNLDIIQAYNNPDTRIRILLGGEVVTGCVIADTSMQAPIQWNDPLQQLAEMAKQKLQGLLGSALSTGVDILRQASPVQAQPMETTIKQFVSTGGPTVPLSMLFLAVNPSDDVRVPINKIMKYVWPTNSGGVTFAPGGYKNVVFTGGGGSAGQAPGGVITVEIGRWFSAKQIMLITGDPTPTYSKEVVSGSGLPLWSSINVTFVPYRMITYDDWMSFFP